MRPRNAASGSVVVVLISAPLTSKARSPPGDGSQPIIERTRYEAGVAQRITLTEDQVLLLRWIADGCPNGVMDNNWYRISAAALQRRGLVAIAGKRATWTASITAAGSEYLAAVDGSEPPIARQANVSVTQQLIDDVVAAGGVLRVECKSYYDPGRVDYAYRARLAERYDKVPAGKRLTVTRDGEELEIRLEDAPHRVGGRPDLVPVEVPERIGRYHAAARQFRDLSAQHEVSRQMIPRATRILHAIAREAERRGWLTVPTEGGSVKIVGDEHAYWVHFSEEGVHERGRWEREGERYRNVSRYSFLDPDRERMYPSGAYDAEASGRLKVTLSAERARIYEGRQSRWADRQSWTLEECLPQLFREIEERTRIANNDVVERRIAAERAAERARLAADERERTWHRLMDRAGEQLLRGAVRTEPGPGNIRGGQLLTRACGTMR